MRTESCLKSPALHFRKRELDRNTAESAKVTAHLEHRWLENLLNVEVISFKSTDPTLRTSVSSLTALLPAHTQKSHTDYLIYSALIRVPGWSSAIPDSRISGGEMKHKWEIRGRQADYGRVSLAKRQDEAVTLLSEVCSWFGCKDNSKIQIFPSVLPFPAVCPSSPLLLCWGFGGAEGTDPPRFSHLTGFSEVQKTGGCCQKL